MFDELYPWPNDPQPALKVVYAWATGASEVPTKELFHAGWNLAGCVGGVLDPHDVARALTGARQEGAPVADCKKALAEDCKKALDALAPRGDGPVGAIDWVLILRVVRTLLDLLAG